MLRYLTHKLRNQSITESDAYNAKTDDDHDSGTESDDEGADIEELQKYMETIICLDGGKADRKKVSHDHEVTRSSSTRENNSVNNSSSDQVVNNASSMCAQSRQRHSQDSRADDPDSPVPEPALDSALPSDSDHNFDHHSSEEELEVINGELCRQHHHHHPPPPPPYSSRHHVVRSVQQQQQQQQHPEKRKWSQVNKNGRRNGGQRAEDGCTSGGESSEDEGEDDDEEVRNLMWCDVSMAPVEFRTSPPANVHKPRKCLSPPPKVFHLSSVGVDLPPHELCSVSPRKRHRRTPTVATAVVLADRSIQRPCLDFEKMQQINRVRLL